ITIQQVLDLSLALCNALEYLHDVAVPGRIVCHRDLKPDNTGFAQDGTLKLIDFGLGKATHGPVLPPGLGDREKLDEGGGGGGNHDTCSPRRTETSAFFACTDSRHAFLPQPVCGAPRREYAKKERGGWVGFVVC
ncbi:unnamed protein product, partial [Ectocarpus sp. 6 AP-2014]